MRFLPLVLVLAGCSVPIAGRWRNTSPMNDVAPGEFLIVFNEDGTGRFDPPEDSGYWYSRDFRWERHGRTLELSGGNPAYTPDATGGIGWLNELSLYFHNRDCVAVTDSNRPDVAPLLFRREVGPVR